MDRLDQCGLKSKTMEFEEDFFDYGTEEIAEDQDPGDQDLLSALRQKEEEVILAARLGNALLLENRQLRDQGQKLQEHYAHTLEELEQGRHQLRVKLSSCESQWESQVGDLEREVRELGAQVETLTQAVGEAEREKGRTTQDHAEHTQRLREQLSTAMEVERAMSNELRALKEQLSQAATQSSSQDDELISALREQVLRLSQREQGLEERLASVSQENEGLRESLASLHQQLALQDQRSQQRSQQLSEAWGQVEEERSRSRELQAAVESLQEEVSFQEARSPGEESLLSELESSLAAAQCGLSTEQMRRDVSSALDMLLPLTPAGATPGGPPTEDLRALLRRLTDTARTLAGAAPPQEMNPAFVDGSSDLCGNQSAAELRDQNAELQRRNAELKKELENEPDQSEVVQQAIKERDEAIAKKILMEGELVRSKNEMMSLNNQLLEAIQRKLVLSQELEAWQEDIQIIINQQLMAQQQSEQLQRNPPHSNGKSFFRKPSASPAPSPPARQPAHPTSWALGPADQEKSQSPWKQWLRLGKRAQQSK